MITKNSSKNPQRNHSDSKQPGLVQKSMMWFKGQKLTETRKAIVLNDLIDAGSPGVDFFILILFSGAIATFGLIADLSVVTIGAQLIDPLMSPILGLAVASVSGLQRMFKRSLIAIIKGAVVAVGLSTSISFFAYRLPFSILASIPHEVLSRTTATPLDLGIAIVGGAAAAYALAHPRLNAALPGLAIATALMPPLCTIGFGVAFQSTFIILGGLLQFCTNFVAITFSAIITFVLMGFGPSKVKRNNDLSRSVLVSTLMMLIIAIPLAILAWNTISAARLNNLASSVILDNLPASAQPQLVDLVINSSGDEKDFTATLRMVRELTPSEAYLVHNALADQLGNPITLKIVTLPMQIIK